MYKSLVSNHYLKAISIWGLAALFYFYDNMLQVTPAAMKPELSLAFIRTAEEFGSLSAWCLYAYAIMQIPAGLFVDKFGARKVLTIAYILCASGALIFGISSTLLIAKIGRVFIGIGAGFAFVSCVKIISAWFLERHFAFFAGATVTIGYFGAVFSLAFLNSLVKLLGWREVLQWGALLGFILGAITWLLVRDKPNTIINKGVAIADTSREFGLIEGLKIVCKNKQSWLCSIYGGMIFSSFIAFGGLWAVPFLEEAHGFDRDVSGKIISLMFIGFMIGAPFFGWLSDYLKSRKRSMYLANIFVTILMVIIIYIPNLSHSLLRLCLFLMGFFFSGFIVSFTVIVENNSPKISGTAIGFMNFLNTLFGAMLQSIIGISLDIITDNRMLGKGFTLIEYQKAFLVLLLAIFVSFFFLFFIKETYCKQQVY